MEAWTSERRTVSCPVAGWIPLSPFFDHDLKSLGPGIRFGDIGDDVLLAVQVSLATTIFLPDYRKESSGRTSATIFRVTAKAS